MVTNPEEPKGERVNLLLHEVADVVKGGLLRYPNTFEKQKQLLDYYK